MLGSPCIALWTNSHMKDAHLGADVSNLRLNAHRSVATLRRTQIRCQSVSRLDMQLRVAHAGAAADGGCKPRCSVLEQTIGDVAAGMEGFKLGTYVG